MGLSFGIYLKGTRTKGYKKGVFGSVLIDYSLQIFVQHQSILFHCLTAATRIAAHEVTWYVISEQNLIRGPTF